MGLLDYAPQGAQQGGSKHWSGTVSYGNQRFNVVNGVCDIEGEKFYVSDDGKLVVNSEQHIVAVIQNGQVKEITPEIHDQLAQDGLIEQSEAVPDQA